MKLYRQENKNIIYQSQYKDPFFEYLTLKIFSRLGKKKGRVLDLGCGCGRNIIAAAESGFSVVGVDICSKALSIAETEAKKKRLDGEVRLIKRDMLKIGPSKLGKFDFCILSEVIEHLDCYQKAIDFAYSSLKKGGILIITAPNDPKQWNLLDEYAEHLKRFTIKEVRTALSSFENVEIFTIGFPFHRSVITLYDYLLKFFRKKHKAKTFRQNNFFFNLYGLIGSVVLRVDNIFNFTPWGTTIVAIAEK